MPAMRLWRIVAMAMGMLLVAMSANSARAEDGYDLWLRYRPLPAQQAAAYRSHAAQLVIAADTPTEQAARQELLRGLGGLLGQAPALSKSVTQDGAILLGTPASSLIQPNSD